MRQSARIQLSSPDPMPESAGTDRGSEMLAALQDPEHFRVLVQDVQLAAVFLDAGGRVAHCNPFLLRLTGWERDEVEGHDWFERFLPPTERDELRRRFIGKVASGNIAPLVLNHIVSRRGEHRLLRWSNTLLRGADGEILGTASIGEDVTERERAEEALWVQNAYYRQLFHSSPVGIVLVDNADRVVDSNPGFTRLFGWQPEEVRGRHLTELIIPPQLVDEATALSQAVLGGVDVSHETVRRHRDGSEVPVKVLGSPVELGDRQLGVFALYLDVGERKRAEEALRRSEERYALAARGANDGLWDWDLERNEIYYSSRWASMLGFEEGELGNDPQEWFSRVHPGDRGRLRHEIGEHVEGRSPHFQCEYRLRHRNGAFRWMLSRGLAVRDEGDRAYRMAGSQTDISDRKQAESQLLHDALHDALTGLPNRALFINRLEMALQRGRRSPRTRFAVLFLDLDRFKVINDSLGHRLGDELLVALADRLRSSVRVIDTVARLGGDEFGFLLEGLVDVKQAIRNAERILEELGRPFHLSGHEVFTSGSIGIAIGDAECGGPEQILRDADIAMYRAKAQGRAAFTVFDQEMHREAVAAMQLENDLRRALERKELELHYQPVVCLADGRLCGFEALLRWHHPERGLLLPTQFIPTAEETGLIVPLGAWVLESACRQIAAWDHELVRGKELGVSVNLSARQLAHPDLVPLVRRTLEMTGAPASRLKLEITESVLMADAPATQNVLQQLRRVGLSVVIDDFGTGYSSLAYLHQFPIDTLKIDRSFVSRLGADDEEIVRAIVTLGRALGMQVLGEGVETPAQLAALGRLGCHLAQGFLLSPPLPAAEAEALLLRAGPMRLSG
jgi:diguanylate cyclase (GGDEF)-like protein/PAS domain S-box-containing protein